MEFIWREQGLQFEDFSDGSFTVHIRSAVIRPPPLRN